MKKSSIDNGISCLIAWLIFSAVAYAGFFNGGVSVTPHRDDVKIRTTLQLQ